MVVVSVEWDSQYRRDGAMYSLFYTYVTWILGTWTFDHIWKQFSLKVHSTECDQCEPVIVKPGNKYSYLPPKTKAVLTCPGNDKATGKSQHPEHCVGLPTSPATALFSPLTLSAWLSTVSSCPSPWVSPSACVSVALAHCLVLIWAYLLPSSTTP